MGTNYSQFHQVLRKKTQFLHVLESLHPFLVRGSDFACKHRIWQNEMSVFKNLCDSPNICGSGSSVPNSISILVSSVYKSLVMFDFSKRCSSLDRCRQQIDNALRALENQKRESLYYKELAIRRRKRKEKVMAAQVRHDRYRSNLTVLPNAR